MSRNNILISAFVIIVGIALFVSGINKLDGILAEETMNIWSNIQDKEVAEKPIAVSPKIETEVIRSGKEGSGYCSFSCNVDWGEDIIPQMLEVFEDKDIKITFYVTGRWAENNSELLKQMYEAGHEIQNHGYGHKLCSQISKEQIKDEIVRSEEAILKATCIKTNVFAPPSGDFDEKTVELCQELGYKTVLWSADTIDWKEGSTADVIKARVLKKNMDGAIILMHPKAETLKALPGLIDEIEKQGINIVPLYRLPL